jgi:hypothetical protein
MFYGRWGGGRGLTRRPEKLVEAGSTRWTVLEDTNEEQATRSRETRRGIRAGSDCRGMYYRSLGPSNIFSFVLSAGYQLSFDIFFYGSFDRRLSLTAP